MNAIAVMVMQNITVKKLISAHRRLVEMGEFVWIWLKDMKEAPINVYVPMVRIRPKIFQQR